jgi:hypothetical protein
MQRKFIHSINPKTILSTSQSAGIIFAMGEWFRQVVKELNTTASEANWIFVSTNSKVFTDMIKSYGNDWLVAF